MMNKTSERTMKNMFLDAVNGDTGSKARLCKKFGDWGYRELVEVFERSGKRWRKVRAKIDRWAALGVSFDTVAGDPSRTQL